MRISNYFKSPVLVILKKLSMERTIIGNLTVFKEFLALGKGVQRKTAVQKKPKQAPD